MGDDTQCISLIFLLASQIELLPVPEATFVIPTTDDASEGEGANTRVVRKEHDLLSRHLLSFDAEIDKIFARDGSLPRHHSLRKDTNKVRVWSVGGMTRTEIKPMLPVTTFAGTGRGLGACAHV